MRRRLPPGVEVLAAHEYFPRFHSNDVDVMNAFESVREANEAAMKADEERKLLGLGEHGGGNRARAFAPHWDNDAIVGGLESGELMRGTIKVCRWRPEEATVRVGEDEERTDAAETTEMIILWKRSETFWYLPERCGTGHSTATAWPCVCCRGVGGCRRKGRTRWRKVTPTPTLREEDGIQTETKKKPEPTIKSERKRRLVPTAEVVGVLRRRGADIVATIAEDEAPEGSTHTLEERQIQQRPGHPDGPTIPPVPTTDPPRRRARGPTTGRSHHAVAGAQQTPGGAGGQGAREVRGFNGGGQRAVSGARHRNKRVFAGEFLFMYVRAIILD